MNRQLPTRYEVCEKVPQHTSTDNPVLLSPFNSVEEALSTAKSYGYIGDNYYVRPISKST